MLRSLSRALGCWCAISLFWACGSDDGDGTPSHTMGGKSGGAGKAGGGGMAGKGSGGGGATGGGGSGGDPGEAGTAGEADGHAGDGTSGEGGGAGAPGGAGAGGAPGASGEAGAGEGGSAGTPSGGEACASCATGCDDELARCTQSPLCSAWLACVTACDTSSCVAACDAKHTTAPLLVGDVYACFCGSDCNAECALMGACDKSCVEGDGPPAASATAPAVLTDTGLYVASTGSSGVNGWQLAPYVRSFAPEYELWADGALKERYIYLPRCSPIESNDMDHWNFPVGTRIWKQFTRDNARVETRMLSRYGGGFGDWLMVSYQWQLPATVDTPLNPETAALAPEAGVVDANGTSHNIPGVVDCQNCHNKLSERVLGFSAIQLSYAASAGIPGLTFSELADRGMISYAPVRTGYDPPGNETERAALGYLHANCGNCHNETGASTPAPTMWLRLLVGQTSVTSSHASLTAVNQATGNPSFPVDRIEPRHPEQSSVILRMQRSPALGETLAMPPVGRKLKDQTGIDAVSAWINLLPE